METQDFYSKATDYWSTISPTVDGMLGGLSKVSPADVSFSKEFLSSFIFNGTKPLPTRFALDVGAGIGRVTKNLLVHYFSAVDLLEANPKFLEAAPAYLGPEVMRKIRNMYTCGLQDFFPERLHSAEGCGQEAYYDCIWCQWVLSHLRDADLVSALKRLKSVLNGDGTGMIFVKENLAKQVDEFDDADSSVTRTRESFLKVFSLAGLSIVKEAKQTRFPQDLYEVRIFVLR